MNAQLILLPVLLQIAHTLVHAGTIQVPLRRLFTFGCVALILMTALAAWVLVVG